MKKSTVMIAVALTAVATWRSASAQTITNVVPPITITNIVPDIPGIPTNAIPPIIDTNAIPPVIDTNPPPDDNGGNNGNDGGNQNPGNNNRDSDRRWLEREAAASLHLIALGNLAISNSATAEIQEFAAILVADHTASFEEANALAAGVGVSSARIERRSQARGNERLSGLTGTEFDAAFLNVLIREHMREIQSLEQEALRGRNPEARTYARKQLSVEMNHLVIALEVREALGLNTFRR